jgi:hypothetical protein
MTEEERELDLALAEALQENRKLRSDNEELKTLYAEKVAVMRDMGGVLVSYEKLIVDMADRIKQLEKTNENLS